MSASAPLPVPRRFWVSHTLRHLSAMLLVMWGVGLLPVFALMRVPARTGAIRHESITGAAAEQHLQFRMAENPSRQAAYRQAIGRLKASLRGVADPKWAAPSTPSCSECDRWRTKWNVQYLFGSLGR